MDKIHYIISEQGSHWIASVKGTVLGPFVSSDEAVKAAIGDAETRPKGDDEVEVFVQNANRETVSVWRSSRSPGA